MLNTAFAPWPSFTQEEADAVSNVLLSNKVNYWTGQETRSFETEFAQWSGSHHAIALTNGTVALDLALEGLGIQAGAEVIVTPRTFIASASSVISVGATPVFADVDSDSGNLTAQSIRAALTPRTKAVILVHLAGWPCDMDPIMELSREHGFKVIEDCAQSHGAHYKGKSLGSIGHVAAWSFCQDKIMTTGGEGGMVTTNDHDLWSRMWSFKDHGKSWAAVYETDHPPGFRWLHEDFGTNWRMTEMQAVIGRIQLKRMKNWHTSRKTNAALLYDGLTPFCGDEGMLRCPQPTADSQHAFYKFYAYVRPECLAPGWTRDKIVQMINAAGVPCFQGSCSEVYKEQAFTKRGLQPDTPCATARELGDTSIMFLVHPTLTKQNMEDAVKAIQDVCAQAGRS